MAKKKPKPGMFGGQLKHLRKKKGLSLKDVADSLGVTPQAVTIWENNSRSPSVKNLDALLRLLDAKLTLGGPEGETLSHGLEDHLKQMNELLVGADQLVRAIEYRLVLINNALGNAMVQIDSDQWQHIAYNYELEELLQEQGK